MMRDYPYTGSIPVSPGAGVLFEHYKGITRN